jgi:hypothetical protein
MIFKITFPGQFAQKQLPFERLNLLNARHFYNEGH